MKNQNLWKVARSLDLKPSLRNKKELIIYVVDELMREASRMGQPFDHTLHMFCTRMHSCMLPF